MAGGCASTLDKFCELRGSALVKISVHYADSSIVMSVDAKTTQVILSWLPGYYWDGHKLQTTGAAIAPTQHVNRKNGEVTYYCRPIFTHGATIGLYVRHQGIVDAVARGDI